MNQYIFFESKNINLSLFNEFFKLSSVDYAKYLINLKNTEESKEFAKEVKNRISSLKDKIKEMNVKEKKIKTRIKHRRSLMKLLIKIDGFKQHLKKQNQIQNLKKVFQTVKLRRRKSEEKEFNDFLQQIKEEQKSIDMNLSKNIFNYETPDEMLEYLHSLKTIDN